jgi:hypothetical protein
MTTTLDVVDLTSTLEAASQARAAVRTSLAGAGTETVDHACLMVDELVAKALVEVGAPVRLVLERHPDRLVVEVIDAGGHVGPTDVPAAERVGIAQVMLDAWADTWGTLDQATGSSVWFSVPVA